MFPCFSDVVFVVQEKKKKEELPQNEVPDDEFFAQYMCLGWKLDKTCPFPLDDGNRWGPFLREIPSIVLFGWKTNSLGEFGMLFFKQIGGVHQGYVDLRFKVIVWGLPFNPGI